MVGTLASLGVTDDGPCFVIAEAGVNHNGSLETARRLITEAKRCGADCIKFQTFKAERVVTWGAPKAAYQLRVTDKGESQLAMLQALELSVDAHQELARTARDEGIEFMSTPYDIEDAEMLAGLGVAAFKLASIHLVEIPLLVELTRFRLPMLLSTGMATLGEVDAAVRALRESGQEEFAVLQCTTNYPSPVADANLRAMGAMRDALGVTVGYSDHTRGIAVPLAAVALGARIVEKHFTLDRSAPGPDHACSSDPQEFAALVRGVRDVEAALGSPVKVPSAAERANMIGMRRSIVTRVAISAGTVLRRDLVAFKRPATGLPPARLDEILGRTTRTDLAADTPLQWGDLQ